MTTYEYYALKKELMLKQKDKIAKEMPKLYDSLMHTTQDIEQLIETDCETQEKFTRNKAYQTWLTLTIPTVALAAYKIEPLFSTIAIGSSIILTGIGTITLGSYWSHLHKEKQRNEKMELLSDKEKECHLQIFRYKETLNKIDEEDQKIKEKMLTYRKALISPRATGKRYYVNKDME